MSATLRRSALPGGLFLAAVLAALLFPLLLNDDRALTAQLIRVALYALALLGLNVAMGYTGLLSLATGAIFGAGAFASAVLDDRTLVRMRVGGRLTLVPGESVGRLLFSVVLGTLIGAGIGLLLLLPALRLGRSAYTMVSLYMAVAFPIVVVLERFSGTLGGGKGLGNVRELVIARDTNGDFTAQAQQVYTIVVIVVALAFLVLWRLLASHWGRAFISVRDDEVSAASMGVSPVRTKVLSLGIYSLCAALAGALFAHARDGSADVSSVSGGYFDLSLAIFFFAALVVGGQATLAGPVLGAVALGLFFREFSSSSLDPNLRDVIFGLLLVGFVLLVPGGLGGAAGRGLRRLREGRTRARPHPVTAGAAAERPALPAVGAHQGLVAEAILVRFGGNTALGEVGLAVAPGRVHALVGANGSGKTTMLNVLSGLVRPAQGRVLLDGRDAGGMSATARARTGLRRTFQTPRVAVRLSARENVLTGAFFRYRSGWLGLYLLVGRRRREDAQLRREADVLLAAAGLTPRADVEAEELTHGERRLLEVCRALIGEPKVLLLDEPAAGLAPEEISELAALVRAARDSGCAVLLVEHNLAFVRAVSDEATVLDRGLVIAAGDPETVLSNPAVVESFVGQAA